MSNLIYPTYFRGRRLRVVNLDYIEKVRERIAEDLEWFAGELRELGLQMIHDSGLGGMIDYTDKELLREIFGGQR